MQFLARNAGLTWFLSATAGILLAAVGYTIYLLTFEQRLTESPDKATDSHEVNFGVRLPNSQKTIRSATDLEARLESQSVFSRSLTIRGLLANASQETAKELFRISKDVASAPIQKEIQSIIVEKLAYIDPQDSLEVIKNLEEDQKSLLVEVVFRVWAHSDLDGSVAHASSMDEIGRRSAFAGILSSDLEIANQALDIARQLKTEQVYFDYSAAMLVQEPVDDPESAFKSLLSQHGQRIEEFSEIESRFLVHVVQSWIDREGVEVIGAASRLLGKDSARASMLCQLFLNEDDKMLVLAIFNAMYAMDRDVASMSITKWAEIDPRSALNFASVFDDDRARIPLMRSAVESWFETDPLSLLDSLDQLPPKLKEWSLPRAMFELSATLPERAAQKLHEMPDSVAKNSVANIIAREWGARDLRAALDWVQSDPLGKGINPQGKDLRWSAFRGAFQVNPELALELALQQALDKTAVGFEALLISHLASEDAEAALDLVHYARNSQTREHVYRSIGKAFIKEGKAERAMEMVRSESEEFQSLFFRRVIMSDWAESDAEGMYASLDTLPTIKIQALGAEILLWQHERSSFLNDDQVEKLQHTVSKSPRNEHGW